jgi:hypothetical protein
MSNVTDDSPEDDQHQGQDTTSPPGPLEGTGQGSGVLLWTAAADAAAQPSDTVEGYIGVEVRHGAQYVNRALTQVHRAGKYHHLSCVCPHALSHVLITNPPPPGGERFGIPPPPPPATLTIQHD